MGSVVTERPGTAAGGSGPDAFAWYFFRISGIALVLLAGGHLFITHYLNVPSDTTFDFVSHRWANPLWRTFDWLLLLVALWHGILGMRNVVVDWVGSPGWQLAARSLTMAVGIFFTVLGSITILTFDETAARENTGPLSGELWIADAIGWALKLFAIATYIGVAVLVIYIIKHISLGTRPIYRGDLGQYAWVMHRATGVGILFFLLVHIIDIMLIGLGRDVYDASVEAYADPFLVPMEILLVGAVIYHTLNGLRIILIDFWPGGVHHQKALFWGALVGTILLTLPAAVVIFQAEF